MHGYTKDFLGGTNYILPQDLNEYLDKGYSHFKIQGREITIRDQIMSYGEKLKDILDKCNLSKEEREDFEDFIDGKVFKSKESYPNVEDSLKTASEKNPLLVTARQKIRLAGQWGSIIALFHRFSNEHIG